MASISKTPDVTYVLRGESPRHFSIERVFSDVAGHVGQTRPVEEIQLPASGVRPDRLLRNLGAASKIRGDIIHLTGDAHYVLLAIGRSSRRVVTVHDLNRYAQLTGLKRKAYRALWIWPLRRADAITCVSEFARQQLVQADPALSSRTQVVENPVSEVFVADPDMASIPRHVVAIGTAPNKNLEATISACAAIDEVTLTVVGAMTGAQKALAAKVGVTATERTGISDEELADLYRSAAVVSFPSTAEGFGLPIIEAQACGVPVVTSDIAPLNEVANGGALLVDPMDHEALATALERAMKRESDVEELIAAGRRNAEERSAASVAHQYNEVYHRVTTRSVELDA